MVAITGKSRYNVSHKEMMPVKKSLGTTLNQLRREAGLTQSRVCEKLAERGFEIQNAAVSKWEKDMTMPNAAQFLALCDIYGVTDVMSTFTGRGGSLAGLNAEGRRLVSLYVRVLLASGLYAEESAAAPRVLPLYDLAASAGTGQILDGESCEPIDAADAPERADFAVRIAGDSMEPLIHDGSVVWVRQCAELGSGKVGIFVLNGQAFCKRLHTDGHAAELISFNSAYAPIVPAAGDDLRVLGEVVGVALEA